MTPDLRTQFQQDGYVFMPGFLNASELTELNAELERFIRTVVPSMPAEEVYYEDKQRPETLKQLQRMNEQDDYFARLFLGGKLERLAETLLADQVVGKNLQYFNKPPGVGQPTPAHQDGYYFKLNPPEALTMWLALDVVDAENGCVRYVRGSHTRGMRPHAKTGVLGFSQGITDYGRPEDTADEIMFPAQPGDLLAHHALTIHRADGNRSASRTRRSLGFIYYAASAKEDVATIKEYQQRLNQEWTAAGKI
jgi:phytanoyl-CoA hydroxylase